MGNIETMTPWQEFYSSIKDINWPDCDNEEDFLNLPEWIRRECQEIHGYKIGEYKNQPVHAHRVFPIKTETACQLKWNWSTIFLTTEETASCHRTDHHKFDVNTFDFHNTPRKLNDRRRMLSGLWPEQGCEYCRDIEQAGGQSDRITNLDLPGMLPPVELDNDITAVNVTPRILEVYFDNTCNLKCLYCSSNFSSLWEAENKKYGEFDSNGLVIKKVFNKSQNIEQNKKRIFQWLIEHGHNLTKFNFLGGEPLYQRDLDDCLEHFQKYPAPNMDFQMFTNLNARPERLNQVLSKIKTLIDNKHLRTLTITASLDCWGAEQEYVRFPLKLSTWSENFQTLIDNTWINLVVGSTITPLTIKTLPDLVIKLNEWRQQRPIYHYVNSVNAPSYMFIDIFGDLFQDDFLRALDVMPENNPDQIQIKNYLKGIGFQSQSRGVNPTEVLKLRTFLDEMDQRRGTNWKNVFDWLPDAFEKVLGQQ